MRKILGIFKKPWFLSLIGIVLFALIIWFVGPLVAISGKVILASPVARLCVIMCAMLLWGLNNLRIRNNEKNASKALTSDLEKDAKKAPHNQDNMNADEKMLTRRLQESLSLLKGSRFDREGKLYKLPWYIVIGAPGSGKTTAIQQSGLQFPLQEHIGKNAVRGEGGTRYCDWWFTDDAILIDTAGRYTTQDNPKKVESSAWLGFLKRIKKARPKRPLNGVIVTISISDIINKTETQKQLQITAIKQRIQELNNHLQMQLPVYVIFSKMDIVAGFTSFFGDLEKEQRNQLWGFSSKARTTSNDKLGDWFSAEFNTLVNTLYKRINTRLNREVSVQKRSLITEFPRQMHALESQLKDCIGSIFSANQFETPLYLRSVFFLSSTQERAHSQWVSSIVPPEYCALPVDAATGNPKSYFVQKIFKDFIFSEANIASVTSKVKRRFRLAYSAILFASFASFAGMLYALSNSKQLNEDYIANLEDNVANYEQTTEGGLENPHNWERLNQGLNILRAMPTGFDEGDEQYTYQKGFGLYQGDKLGEQAATSYIRSLESFFMEDLSLMLLQQVHTSFKNDELLYESLKFYLMLYYPAYMDEASFATWVNILWQRRLPSESQKDLRKSLNTHLLTALEQRVSPAPMDIETVTTARETLIKTPLDERAYRRIKNDYIDQYPTEFTLADVLGKKAALIFYRPSGTSLDNGVPNFFSYQGFHSGFNVENLKLAKQLADEQWIYGEEDHPKLSEEEVAKVRERVKAHYLNEYQYRWDTFLSDIAIHPFGTVNRGKTVVRLLSGADQPLITILEAVRKHTDLARVPSVNKETQQALGDLAEDVAGSQVTRLQRLVPADALSGAASLPGKSVSDYYFELNSYVDASPGLPLANLQEAIQGLNTYFQTLSYADDIGQAAFDSTSGEAQKSALTQLNIALEDTPSEIQPWFTSLSRNTRNVGLVATKTHINDVWADEVIPFFNQKLKGKYPLNKSGITDANLADFEEFFAPGGVLDNYFVSYIAPYADTSRRPWRLKKQSGISSRTLVFFERVDQVRRAYFGEGEALNVAFTIKPHTLDKTASGILIKSGDDQLNYQHGPVRAKPFTWPAKEIHESKLVFSLVSKGTPISARAKGEWSWFHLLDDYAKTKKTENGGLMLAFNLNGIASTQELEPDRVDNPFTNDLFRDFQLPRLL